MDSFALSISLVPGHFHIRLWAFSHGIVGREGWEKMHVSSVP